MGNRRPKQIDFESLHFNQMIIRLNVGSKETAISMETGAIESKLINLQHHRQLEDMLGMNRTTTHKES